MVKRDWKQTAINTAAMPYLIKQVPGLRTFLAGTAILGLSVGSYNVAKQLRTDHLDQLEQIVEPEPVIDYVEPIIVEPEKSFILENYREDPGRYIRGEPEALTLARLIGAEARSEYENKTILEHKGSSVLNRVNDREQNETVGDAIFEDEQYKAVMDHNKDYFHNPSKFIDSSCVDKEAWEAIYDVAEDLIENGPKYETDYAIYQSSKDLDPSKEYGWVGKGLRKNMIEKIDVIPTKNGGKYHFYNDI